MFAALALSIITALPSPNLRCAEMVQNMVLKIGSRAPVTDGWTEKIDQQLRINVLRISEKNQIDIRGNDAGFKRWGDLQEQADSALASARTIAWEKYNETQDQMAFYFLTFLSTYQPDKLMKTELQRILRRQEIKLSVGNIHNFHLNVWNGKLHYKILEMGIEIEPLLNQSSGEELRNFNLYPESAPIQMGGNGFSEINFQPWGGTDGIQKLSERIPVNLRPLFRTDYQIKAGPNCRDFCLQYHGYAASNKAIEATDFHKILKERFDLVEAGSNLQTGDVMVFFGGHDHAAIYLGDGLMAHKPSHSASAPYVFDALSRFQDRYLDWSPVDFYRKKSN